MLSVLKLLKPKGHAGRHHPLVKVASEVIALDALVPAVAAEATALIVAGR